MIDKTASVSDSQLLTDFMRYFELGLALSPEQREAVFQVRYRVYCEEFGYEPVERFRDGLERDEYDASSIHCLVTHRESGVPAGCVRVVMPKGDELVPMEQHCGEALDAAFMERFDHCRDQICEISRLAVDGAFRRRHGEAATRFGAHEAFTFAEREKRTFPLIAVSLFLACAAAAAALGRKHCFAIMEPFLPKILQRTGVEFARIGQDFDFRGTRAPYYANIDELVRNAPEELRVGFHIVRAQFEEALAPAGVERRALASMGVDGRLQFLRAA